MDKLKSILLAAFVAASSGAPAFAKGLEMPTVLDGRIEGCQRVVGIGDYFLGPYTMDAGRISEVIGELKSKADPTEWDKKWLELMDEAQKKLPGPDKLPTNCVMS